MRKDHHTKRHPPPSPDQPPDPPPNWRLLIFKAVIALGQLAALVKKFLEME